MVHSKGSLFILSKKCVCVCVWSSLCCVISASGLWSETFKATQCFISLQRTEHMGSDRGFFCSCKQASLLFSEKRWHHPKSQSNADSERQAVRFLTPHTKQMTYLTRFHMARFWAKALAKWQIQFPPELPQWTVTVWSCVTASWADFDQWNTWETANKWLWSIVHGGHFQFSQAGIWSGSMAPA